MAFTKTQVREQYAEVFDMFGRGGTNLGAAMSEIVRLHDMAEDEAKWHIQDTLEQIKLEKL